MRTEKKLLKLDLISNFLVDQFGLSDPTIVPLLAILSLGMTLTSKEVIIRRVYFY